MDASPATPAPTDRRFWPSSELRKVVKGRLLMAHQTARLMGVSKTELRNRTKAGLVESHVDPVSGWTWYSEAYIRAWLGLSPEDSNGKELRPLTKRERRSFRKKFPPAPIPEHAKRQAAAATMATAPVTSMTSASTSSAPGQENSTEFIPPIPMTADAEIVAATRPKMASAIFKALKEQKTLADIVIELRAHPDAVRACANEYAAMTETLYISAEDRKALQELPYFGVEHTLTNGKQLISAIHQMTTKRLTCARCNARNARFCGDEACETPRETEARRVEEEARAAQSRKDNDALLHATADLLRSKPIVAQPFMPTYQPEVAEAMGGAK